MRKRIILCLLPVVVTLALSGVAAADTGVGLPIVPATSWTAIPPGFSSDAASALAAAKRDPRVLAVHRRMHPLELHVDVWARSHWLVDFLYHGKLAVEVDVSRSGRVTGVWAGPLAIALYARGHYAPLFDSGWVVIPFSLLFLLPFIDPRRPLRMLHLDALVLESFLISYYLFDHAKLDAAVWLIYPPLIYLLVRMLILGIRRPQVRPRFSVLLPGRTLAVGLLVLLAARVALSLANHLVIDVGYASVIGAHRISHGQALYYASASHGDTYGPIAYLAYLPFELLFPWHGSWDYLASAHAASVVFDLLTVGALILLGRRLRRGAEGRRLGLTLAWLWAACPYTLLGLLMHTNDGLVALLTVLTLLAFASPAASGALVGLAAMAKFSPGALLPLVMAPRARGLKRAGLCAAAFAVVVAAALVPFLPPGGLSEFYRHTIGYQLDRVDVFSLWALHPGLSWAKTLLEALALLLAGGAALILRERNLVQAAALAAAVTLALQLPAVHWFYYYLIWVVPLALVALLGGGVPRQATAPRPEPSAEAELPSLEREPALA